MDIINGFVNLTASDLDKLGDMFPKASPDHIIKCLKQANGHINTAVELLLMDFGNNEVCK